MSAFAFPQPGERRNAAAIPVPEDALLHLVIVAWYGHSWTDGTRTIHPLLVEAAVSAALAVFPEELLAELERWARLNDTKTPMQDLER